MPGLSVSCQNLQLVSGFYLLLVFLVVNLLVSYFNREPESHYITLC